MRVWGTLVLALVVLFSTAAAGQSFRGGIQGSVTDQTGAALPGVTVTATNTGTTLTRSVQTDATGTYAFTELPLGTYDIAAALMGFSTMNVRGVHVEASMSQRAPHLEGRVRISPDDGGWVLRCGIPRSPRLRQP